MYHARCFQNEPQRDVLEQLRENEANCGHARGVKQKKIRERLHRDKWDMSWKQLRGEWSLMRYGRIIRCQKTESLSFMKSWGLCKETVPKFREIREDSDQPRGKTETVVDQGVVGNIEHSNQAWDKTGTAADQAVMGTKSCTTTGFRWLSLWYEMPNYRTSHLQITGREAAAEIKVKELCQNLQWAFSIHRRNLGGTRYYTHDTRLWG